MKYYNETTEDVLASVGSSRDGLSDEEVRERREKYGKNALRKEEQTPAWKLFVKQFKSFLVLLLVFAAGVSVATSYAGGHPEFVDAGLILVILVGNAVFGFVQDYKAEQAVESLKSLSAPEARVRRKGVEEKVKSAELVPGDIVLLGEGDKVPADIRVLESTELTVDESMLTGESLPVKKVSDPNDEGTVLAERTSMAYKQTSVVSGKGVGVVVGTGMETEVGDIATALDEAEDTEDPFEAEVDMLGKRLGVFVIGLAVIIAVTQYALGVADIATVLLVSVSLIVAAVPEGLPAVVTLTLALGSKRLLKKKALVRRLSVVEGLGRVDVILTDKTGTLTENNMRVVKGYSSAESWEGPEGEVAMDVLRCARICNDASEDTGEPMEQALLLFAEEHGVENADVDEEVPFSSNRRRMTVLSDGTVYMKGAPEVVLERCTHVKTGAGIRELSEDDEASVRAAVREFGDDALRVLGFAEKKGEDLVEEGLVFTGLLGLMDPPREEVKGAIADFVEAGIRVVMATGDNAVTGAAVARRVGIETSDVLTGSDVEELSDEELQEKVRSVSVYARMAPKQKVRVLRALQANGNKVAMTGDGVNDAPTLKEADVGVAMGQRGTEVAKQAADMVLLDDNFVTIRDAVEEGRGIFDNIQKFVNYLLASNTAEVYAVFLGTIIGMLFFAELFAESIVILTPVMLLWINLVTDGLPALALGVDPVNPKVMKRDPRDNASLLSKGIFTSSLSIGFVTSAIGLALFFYVVPSTSLIAAQTALFTFLVAVEMISVQIIRSRYKQGLFSNAWLVLGVISTLVLQALLLVTPLKDIFELAITGEALLGIALGFFVYSVAASLYVATRNYVSGTGLE